MIQSPQRRHIEPIKKGGRRHAFFFSHHPIYTVAVKAANSNDDEKVGAALKDLVTYDRSLTLENSRELRQVILGCQGELHLNTVKWYFENQYKLAVNFTAPNIPYRETITKSAEAMYRHKKQSGGSGQFGEVHMLIEPYFDGTPCYGPRT